MHGVTQGYKVLIYVLDIPLNIGFFWLLKILCGKCCGDELSEVSDTVLKNTETQIQRPKSEDSTKNVKSVIKDQQQNLKELYEKTGRDQRLKKLAKFWKKGSDQSDTDSIEMKVFDKKNDIIDIEDTKDANDTEIETSAIVHQVGNTENLSKITEKNAITVEQAPEVSALLTPANEHFDIKEIEMLVNDLESANQRATLAEKEAENLRDQLENGSDQAIFTCLPCKKTFTALKSLQAHVKTVHNKKKTFVTIEIDEEFSP